MDDLAQNIYKFLLEVDSIVELNVRHLISNYGLEDNPKFPIKFNIILLSIKVVIYNLPLLLAFSGLKIILRENPFVTIVFTTALIAAACAAFLIFLGFFQVLFS